MTNLTEDLRDLREAAVRLALARRYPDCAVDLSALRTLLVNGESLEMIYNSLAPRSHGPANEVNRTNGILITPVPDKPLVNRSHAVDRTSLSRSRISLLVRKILEWFHLF